MAGVIQPGAGAMDPHDPTSQVPPLSSHPHPCHPASFLDVLRELDLHALDTLYDHLQAAAGLGVARLACHALRQAIDGSVREGRFVVTPAVGGVWRAGRHLPTLARWPRLAKVLFSLDIAESEVQGEGDDGRSEELDWAALLTLPFVVQRPASPNGGGWPHISELTLRVKLRTVRGQHVTPVPSAEVAAASLAPHLPGLRRLTFHPDTTWSYRQLQGMLLYSSLASSCRHLTSLRLCSFRALRCVGGLAGCGSLTKLTVCQERSPPCSRILTTEIAASLATLTQLQELCLLGCDSTSGHDPGPDDGSCSPYHSSGVPALLRHLPQSLLLLNLGPSSSVVRRADERGGGPSYLPVGTTLHLRGGRVDSLHVGKACRLGALALLAELLLRVGLLAPCLESVLLAGLCSVKEEDCTDHLLPALPLYDMMMRCGGGGGGGSGVELCVLNLVDGTTARAAGLLVQLFGVPTKLYMRGVCARLRGGAPVAGPAACAAVALTTPMALVVQAAAPGASALASASAGLTVAPSRPPLSLSSATVSDAMQAVAARIEALGVALSTSMVASTAGRASSSGAIRASDGGGGPSGETPGRCGLLLRGPFIAMLGLKDCNHGSPFHKWLSRLAKQAGLAVPPAGGEAAAPEAVIAAGAYVDLRAVAEAAAAEERRNAHYIALAPAAAVLVVFPTQRMSAAAATAVSCLAAAAASPPGTLVASVLPVAMISNALVPTYLHLSEGPKCCFVAVLQQVLQDAWDAGGEEEGGSSGDGVSGGGAAPGGGADGSSGGSDERAMAVRLMALIEQVVPGLPPVVVVKLSGGF